MLMEPVKEIHIQTEKSSLWTVDNFTEDIYDDLVKTVSPLLEHEPPVFVWGKWRNQPLDIAFFSDESIGYKYSNQLMKSQPLKTIPLLFSKKIRIVVSKKI